MGVRIISKVFNGVAYYVRLNEFRYKDYPALRPYKMSTRRRSGPYLKNLMRGLARQGSTFNPHARTVPTAPSKQLINK